MAAFVEVLPNIYQGVVVEKRVSQASVNLYIIKDNDSCLFIDSGYDGVYSNSILQAGIEQLGIDKSKARVLVTHAHQDHFGGVGWCVQQGMKIFISKQEYEYLLAGEYFPLSVALMAGIPASEYPNIYDKGAKWSETAQFKPADMPCTFLAEGDKISAGGYEFDIITYKGHSREQICLLDSNRTIMFSADQIVTGSPSVNMRPGDDGALCKYLADLRSIRRMDLEYLLPGHGPILSKKDGSVELAVSNIETSYYRLMDTIMDIIDDGSIEGCSAIEIVSYMYHKDFESYFQDMKRSKMVMTNKVLACMEYLCESGRLQRVKCLGRTIYQRY